MAYDIYTHIIVGAGSSGCVLAARICENKKFNVLLIEAGPDYGAPGNLPDGVRDSRKVPMRGQTDVFDPSIDWNLDVEISGEEGGTSIMQVPQAKIMGGGSSINGGTALRSTAADSREWVALGNPAWDFESVYAIYQSLEGDQLRGTNGPHPIVRVSDAETGVIQKAFLQGAGECGFKKAIDFNETGVEGCGPSPVCRHGDTRISAADTFIDPIRHRTNFTILPNSLVDRVTFDKNKRATGILLSNGAHVHATEEVVVSAGAILSPALLQRSGVGPAALCTTHNIVSVIDLPVGSSASDHPCIPIVAKPRKDTYLDSDYSLQCQARWSSTSMPGAIDHQLICFSYLFATAPDPRVQQRSLAGSATGHVAGIGCNLNKPTSSGSVAIVSSDPTILPRVVPNYLDTEHDRASARELVRKGFAVITSPAMQRVLEPPFDISQETVRDNERLDAYIRGQVTSTYHFCCTNRMAAKDKGGVVDQSGRVHGVSRLRVCDASVIPTVPASNTMWTTMMFAERIGRSIRDGKDVEGIHQKNARL